MKESMKSIITILADHNTGWMVVSRTDSSPIMLSYSYQPSGSNITYNLQLPLVHVSCTINIMIIQTEMSCHKWPWRPKSTNLTLTSLCFAFVQHFCNDSYYLTCNKMWCKNLTEVLDRIKLYPFTFLHFKHMKHR